MFVLKSQRKFPKSPRTHGFTAQLAMLTLFNLLLGCTTLQPLNLPEETALPQAEGQLWTKLAAQRPEDWFHILNDGQEAIEWRLRIIDSATQALDLQTFLWKEDPTGLRVLRHILQAADRDIRVRILIDDTFTVNEDSMLAAINQHPNIACRIYNPFKRRYDSIVLRQFMNLGEFTRLNHRMHNKILIVDNRAGIIGGRNLADEYFGNHATSNFRDMEVLTSGPAVQSISRNFDRYWNSDWSFPVEQVLAQSPSGKDLDTFRIWLQESADSNPVEDPATRNKSWYSVSKTAIPAKAALFSDEPARKNPAAPEEFPTQLARQLNSWIETAEQELILVSAYLIPTPELEEAIERAEKRGVQVRILTNSLQSNNHTAAHSAYRHHIKRLIGHGADLHEVRARAKDRLLYMQSPIADKDLGLHAKILLIDDDLVFIGSTNLDPRSLHLNTEVGLLIQSIAFNQMLRRQLAIDFDRRNAWHLQASPDGGIIWVGDDMILNSQPAKSGFQLLEDWFLSILPIEQEM